MPARLVAAEPYAEFGARVLQAHGVPADDARLVVDNLVTAELWGHASHGMLRLPWYVARLRGGALRAITFPEVVPASRWVAGPLPITDRGQSSAGRPVLTNARRPYLPGIG